MLTRSISRKGCAPDDATWESFFSQLKTQLRHPCTDSQRPPNSSFSPLIQAFDGTAKNESRLPPRWISFGSAATALDKKVATAARVRDRAQANDAVDIMTSGSAKKKENMNRLNTKKSQEKGKNTHYYLTILLLIYYRKRYL